MPILVAPTAFHCLAHPEGEVATARAAGKAGTIMMLSTLSTSSIEDVMSEATGTVWFQLYVYCFFLKLDGLRSYFFKSSYKSALYLPANLAAWAIFPSVSSMSWRR